MPDEIYLDYNATTPVIPQVIHVIKEALSDNWGNPSSAHKIGKNAKNALEKARRQVAELIGAKDHEIIFTSGGTESNNLAIIGAARKLSTKGKHLVTTKIEHPSVLNPFIYLLEQGFEVDFISPGDNGIVNVSDIEKTLRKDTILCSVMTANNETGAIQPIAEIGKICKERGILFHTDAAQAVGKIEINVNELNADLLTIAGHKLYAPKGIGALYVRQGSKIEKILFGAGQESGLRPGTEPVPLACGLGEACSFLKGSINDNIKIQSELRERLFELLKEKNPDLVRFVPGEYCLPNTLFVSFPGLIGSEVLDNAKIVQASTGAACHDRSVTVSHVLSAMNVPKELAKGALRLTLGIFTTSDQIEKAADAISVAVKKIKDNK